MPYTDNGMRDLFLDKDGRIWFGTPPNNRVSYFYLVQQAANADARRRGCESSRGTLLLAGGPASHGEARQREKARPGLARRDANRAVRFYPRAGRK